MKSITTTFLLLFIGAVLTAQSPAYNPQINSIDVQHYRFSLTLKDDTDRIEGQAEITLRFKQAGNSFVLDLTNIKSGKGMEVSTVIYNNTALKFSHSNDRLNITLPSSIPTGESITVSVQYAGIPADGLIIDANKFGDRTFFGDNWPNRAHHWLPTVDHPSIRLRWNSSSLRPIITRSLAMASKLKKPTSTGAYVAPTGKKPFYCPPK